MFSLKLEERFGAIEKIVEWDIGFVRDVVSELIEMGCSEPDVYPLSKTMVKLEWKYLKAECIISNTCALVGEKRLPLDSQVSKEVFLLVRSSVRSLFTSVE